MKKICLFMHSPFSLGGEQRVVTVLSNYLVNKGFDVYFLLTDKSKKVDYNIYNMNKKIHIIFIEEYNTILHRGIRKILNIFRYKKSKHLRFTKNIYCNLFDKNILTKKINGYKFDYIIGVSSQYFGILSVLKPYLKETKIIAWQHSTFESYYKTKNHRFYNQDVFVRYMLKNVDFYILQTQDDKNKMKNEYEYDAKVIENPNTFIIKKISKLEDKNFLAMGRLDKIKGFDKLIESFNIFAKQNKEWKLYIVGDGKERQNLEELINYYNLRDRIILTGKTDNVEKYYLNSTIYLMTSAYEGWGMVVTEAMQHGLPIIGYDIPSTKEIFGSKKCGILVKQYDILKFADAMINLSSNNNLIKYYSSNAIDQVKHFDIEIIGEKWIKVLDKEECYE